MLCNMLWSKGYLWLWAIYHTCVWRKRYVDRSWYSALPYIVQWIVWLSVTSGKAWINTIHINVKPQSIRLSDSSHLYKHVQISIACFFRFSAWSKKMKNMSDKINNCSASEGANETIYCFLWTKFKMGREWQCTIRYEQFIERWDKCIV